MRPVLSAMILVAVGAVGCAHRATMPPTASPASPAPAAPEDEAPIRGAAATATPQRCDEVRVHFPFDSSVVVAEDRPTLEQAGKCLRDQRGIRIVIEGNADERGTVEYNIALGQRRADAVREYLEELGVSADQLKTVSYGKERPVCSEHTESCWRENRRAALVPPTRG